MTYKKKIAIAVFTASLLGGCAAKAPELTETAVMEKYQSVSKLNTQLAEAKKNGVDRLAPEGYKEAQEMYADAFDMARSQEDGADKLAQTGLARLSLATEQAENNKAVMREVLEAREKAVKANAQTTYPEEFKKLEGKLEKATMNLEHEKVEDAKVLREELIKEYTALELASLQRAITQKAEAAISVAKEQGADEHTPNTFKLAQDELSLAINVLSTERTRTDKAQVHADNSVYLAHKSIYLTEIVKDAERRDYSYEELALWYQEQLKLINQPFGDKIAFDKTNHEIVLDIQKKINQKIKAKKETEEALAVANTEIKRLNATHTQQVANIEETNRQAEEANRKAEARFGTIDAMFTKKEADVYRQGNNVLLETHAFDFKVGKSEISSKNYVLLEKIVEAIKLFDNPHIIVMGHTDSTGSDKLNMDLSQKRAETVSSFLQKIGKIDPTNIEAKGYGKTRPVATNETEEGRERNRRIEVLIVNQ